MNYEPSIVRKPLELKAIQWRDGSNNDEFGKFLKENGLFFMYEKKKNEEGWAVLHCGNYSSVSLKDTHWLVGELDGWRGYPDDLFNKLFGLMRHDDGKDKLCILPSRF